MLPVQAAGSRPEDEWEHEQEHDATRDGEQEEDQPTARHRAGDGAVVLLHLQDHAGVDSSVAHQQVTFGGARLERRHLPRRCLPQRVRLGLDRLVAIGGGEQPAVAAPEADRPQLVAQEAAGHAVEVGGPYFGQALRLPAQCRCQDARRGGRRVTLRLPANRLESKDDHDGSDSHQGKERPSGKEQVESASRMSSHCGSPVVGLSQYVSTGRKSACR